MAALRPGRRAVVRVGGTGWGDAAWIGPVYPPGARSRDLLRLYAERFTTVELNSTFYGVPSASTLARWREETPTGFLFSPKVHQSVSRAGSPIEAHDGLAAFCAAMLPLGDRLGPAFLQLPPAFGPDRLAGLASVLRAVPAGLRLAVELRHPAWFRDQVLLDEAFDVFRERGVGAVITDVLGRRDVSHAALPVPWTLVRLVVDSALPSTADRIGAWADRLSRWIGAGLDGIHLFVHEREHVRTARSVADLSEALNARAGLDLPVWRPAEPRQLTLV